MFPNPVLDHFYHPRNVGIADDWTGAYLEQDNPWRIRLLFTVRVDGGLIQEVKFKTQSCVTTTACASALTELVAGRNVAAALLVTPEELSQRLGTIPAEKMHCCRLAVATLRHALESPAESSTGGTTTKGDRS